MVVCFVVGCKSGNNGSKCHLFKAPKTADKEAWIRAIPKRQGKEFNFNSSRLCHLHFDEKFIIKSPEFIVINGEKVPRPCKSHWTLTPNAVPHKFSNEKVPSYFDRPLKRKSPKKRNSYSSKRMKVAKMELEKPPDLHRLVCMKASDIKLPSKSWLLQRSEDEEGPVPIFFHFMSESGGFFVAMKTISVSMDLN